jgi:hypothetical protein
MLQSHLVCVITHLLQLHCVGVVCQQAHDGHLLDNVCRGRAAATGGLQTLRDCGNEEDATGVGRCQMTATCMCVQPTNTVVACALSSGSCGHSCSRTSSVRLVYKQFQSMCA